ncbi:MAG: aldose 1-epimerase family protein [Clostridia bacterium]|nr:aldose 1-epimerase family protein [Clostridia bacterium]
MVYTLKNEQLTVQINSRGAELTSVKCAGGCEYLWQGDPAYWGEHAPWLFPICSHLWEESYTYKGMRYELHSRNFTHSTDFSVKFRSDTEVTLELTANEETRQSYPFDFSFTVTYQLQGAHLHVAIDVKNSGNEVLPFSLGAHPGFNVPLDGDSRFEDWYLEFDKDCAPDEILLTENVYLDGRRVAYPLRDGRKLELSHGLFTLDGRFFARVDNKVTLKSDYSPRFVTIDFPDTPYLGMWSKPNSDAPLLCIEPWHGLPSYDGTVDDMDNKNDMYRLMPGKSKRFALTYTFG